MCVVEIGGFDLPLSSPAEQTNLGWNPDRKAKMKGRKTSFIPRLPDSVDQNSHEKKIGPRLKQQTGNEAPGWARDYRGRAGLWLSTPRGPTVHSAKTELSISEEKSPECSRKRLWGLCVDAFSKQAGLRCHGNFQKFCLLVQGRYPFLTSWKTCNVGWRTTPHIENKRVQLIVWKTGPLHQTHSKAPDRTDWCGSRQLTHMFKEQRRGELTGVVLVAVWEVWVCLSEYFGVCNSSGMKWQTWKKSLRWCVVWQRKPRQSILLSFSQDLVNSTVWMASLGHCPWMKTTWKRKSPGGTSFWAQESNAEQFRASEHVCAGRHATPNQTAIQHSVDQHATQTHPENAEMLACPTTSNEFRASDVQFRLSSRRNHDNGLTTQSASVTRSGENQVWPAAVLFIPQNKQSTSDVTRKAIYCQHRQRYHVQTSQQRKARSTFLVRWRFVFCCSFLSESLPVFLTVAKISFYFEYKEDENWMAGQKNEFPFLSQKPNVGVTKKQSLSRTIRCANIYFLSTCSGCWLVLCWSKTQKRNPGRVASFGFSCEICAESTARLNIELSRGRSGLVQQRAASSRQSSHNVHTKAFEFSRGLVLRFLRTWEPFMTEHEIQADYLWQMQAISFVGLCYRSCSSHNLAHNTHRSRPYWVRIWDYVTICTFSSKLFPTWDFNRDVSKEKCTRSLMFAVPQESHVSLACADLGLRRNQPGSTTQVTNFPEGGGLHLTKSPNVSSCTIAGSQRT